MLFVLTALAAFVAHFAERTLLEARVYKQALRQARFYERLPALGAEQLQSSGFFEPCGEGRQPCEGESVGPPPGEGLPGALEPLASASPQLLDCLEEALGPAEFAALLGGERPLIAPGPQAKRARPCLREHGLPPNAPGVPEGLSLALWMLEPSDWQAIFAELAPADWMQAQLESAIDQVLSFYLDPRSRSATLRLSLQEFKARLGGAPGERALRRLLQAQPACPPGQLGGLASPPTGGFESGGAPICRPEPEMLPQALSNFKVALEKFLAEIPDEATTTLAGWDSRAGGGAGFSREEFFLARLVLRLSPLLPALLILLVALFAVRSWKGWLLWWGIPFLVAGLLALGLALAALPLVNLGLDYAFSSGGLQAGGLPTGVVLLAIDVLLAIVASLAFRIEIAAGALAALGLLMVAASFFLRSKPALAPPPPLEESPRPAG